MTPEFVIIREMVRRPGGDVENFTPGKMYRKGLYFCETCEDEDRQLEDHPERKIYGKTAIPRGIYRLEMQFSPHFGRPMPHILDVPNYQYVMLHGANTANDLLGCIGTGKVRTATGIAQCPDTVARLGRILDEAFDLGREVYLEVK